MTRTTDRVFARSGEHRLPACSFRQPCRKAFGTLVIEASLVPAGCRQAADAYRLAASAPQNLRSYGRGRGVGRGLGVGVILGAPVGVGVAVALGVAVAVAVAVAVGLGVSVGVGEGVGVAATGTMA